MHADSLFTWATLFGFLFTLARVSCVFAFLPLGAFRAAPETAKIVLALGFTVILWPEWKGTIGSEATIGRIIAGVAGEAALGVAIGMSLAIVLEVFQVAAQIVSLQAGFGFLVVVILRQGLHKGAQDAEKLRLRQEFRPVIREAKAPAFW